MADQLVSRDNSPDRASRDERHSAMGSRSASPTSTSFLAEEYAREKKRMQSADVLPANDGALSPRKITDKASELQRQNSFKTSLSGLNASTKAFEQDPKLLKKVKVFLDDKQKVKARLASLYSYFG